MQPMIGSITVPNDNGYTFHHADRHALSVRMHGSRHCPTIPYHNIAVEGGGGHPSLDYARLMLQRHLHTRLVYVMLCCLSSCWSIDNCVVVRQLPGHSSSTTTTSGTGDDGGGTALHKTCALPPPAIGYMR